MMTRTMIIDQMNGSTNKEGEQMDLYSLIDSILDAVFLISAFIMGFNISDRENKKDDNKPKPKESMFKTIFETKETKSNEKPSEEELREEELKNEFYD